MNFDFSEQQKLIQSEARKFLKQQCSNNLARAVMDDDEQLYDQDLWQKIASLGWTALSIPEQYSGLGMAYLELCVVAQELGRALAPVPFSSTVYLLSEALKDYATEAQKQQHLPAVAAGETIGCMALIEANGHSIEHAPKAKVSSGKLSGKKFAVVDGQLANLAIVSAMDENQQNSLYLVELTQRGVDRTCLKSIDPSRPQARLSFDRAECELLGHAGSAVEYLQALYNKAAVLFAFEQLGGCEAALKMGLKYTNQRYAFGRPIASFQAIKHKFADMYVAKELAQANAYYAAWALSSGAEELALAAATARVSGSDAYFHCARENLQAHGGMGYTWEFDCHLHYRRAQQLSLNLGSTLYWKERLASELLVAEV